MQSTVESVEGNKVKLHVTVPADEFERAIDAAFRKLAREVRIPGFRPGQGAPPAARGPPRTPTWREQALRDSLPEFYVDAVTEHDVDVIAPPEIEVTAGQDDGDVEFEAVVEVRPQVHLIGYDELRRAADRAGRRRRDRRSGRPAPRSLRRPHRLRSSADRRRVRDHRHHRIDRRRGGRGPHRHRLPLSRRLRHGRARARRATARRVPARSSSSPRRCPNASATAPAKTRRSA